ncbi:MAG: hypothetical protein IPM55_13255 [Acidobacteria bacterium]|nr:hypothetical protein [Acidobacteriota bacterium]
MTMTSVPARLAYRPQERGSALRIIRQLKIGQHQIVSIPDGWEKLASPLNSMQPALDNLQRQGAAATRR